MPECHMQTSKASDERVGLTVGIMILLVSELYFCSVTNWLHYEEDEEQPLIGQAVRPLKEA